MSDDANTPAPVVEDGEIVFRAACRADNLKSFLKGVSAESLRQLCGWLAREGAISGIPGRVHSFARWEITERWLGGDR